MKKIIIMALFITPFSAAVANPPNSVGCGLGSQLFDGQSGIFPQSLAVTTNGTFGNQTFGITSGTSGCDPNGAVVAAVEVPMFVGANMDSLARDIAVGKGESIESLAALIGIAGSDKNLFFSVTKENYGQIFSSDAVTSGDVVGAIYSVMAKHEQLVNYVPE